MNEEHKSKQRVWTVYTVFYRFTVVLLLSLILFASCQRSHAGAWDTSGMGSCCVYVHKHHPGGNAWEAGVGGGSCINTPSGFATYVTDDGQDGIMMNQCPYACTAGSYPAIAYTGACAAETGKGFTNAWIANGSYAVFTDPATCEVTNCIPTNNVFTCCVYYVNHDAICHTITTFAANANYTSFSSPVTSPSIPPGGQYSFCYTNSSQANCIWQESADCSHLSPPINSQPGSQGTNNLPSNGGPGGGPTGYTGGPSDQTGPGSQYSGPYIGTNSPILWPNTNNITNITMYGDAAIVATMVKIGNAAHSDASDIETDLVGISNAVAHGSGGSGTNIVNVTVTNSPSGLTNKWSEAYGSNGVLEAGSGLGTNSVSLTNGLHMSAQDATNTASSYMGGVLGSMGSMVGAQPGAVGDGGGAPAGLTIAFAGGYNLNLDPAVTVPGSQSFVRDLIKAVAMLYFLYLCLQVLWETAKSYSSSQTGGVPDMNAWFEAFGCGAGGNALGIAVSLVIPIAFVGIWVAVFVGGLALIGSYWNVSSVTAALAGITSTNSITAYLFLSFFPLDFVIGLVWAYFGVRVSATAAVTLSSTAARFLPGK